MPFRVGQKLVPVTQGGWNDIDRWWSQRAAYVVVIEQWEEYNRLIHEVRVFDDQDRPVAFGTISEARANRWGLAGMVTVKDGLVVSTALLPEPKPKVEKPKPAPKVPREKPPATLWERLVARDPGL